MGKLTVVQEYSHGVCVWQDADGYVLGDEDGNFLSMDGICGDPAVEALMEQAAKYWMGSDFSGKASWVNGARKITDMEYDDQQERLLQGLVPDPVESGILAAKKKQSE